MTTKTTDYRKFEDVVFNTKPSNMMFHYNKVGLNILAPVKKVENYGERDPGIVITFEGGSAYVWSDINVRQCRRPDNLIIECEICFRLRNENDEQAGFIYMPKEESN